MTGAIIVNEIITTLATQPSDEEWRCIREFKRRTRELTDNEYWSARKLAKVLEYSEYRPGGLYE